jgi:GTPase SAR1 family protein
MHSLNDAEMTDEEAETERQAFVKKHYIQNMKMLMPGLSDEECERDYLEYAKKTKETKKPEKEPPQPPAAKRPTEKVIPPPEELLARVNEWALHPVTEEVEEEQYLWTHEGKKLKMRLLSHTGQLIGVVGLSGVGKTSLKSALEIELNEKFPHRVISIKWQTKINNRIADKLTNVSNFSEQYLEELWDKMLDKYGGNCWNYNAADTFSAIQKALKFDDPSDEARVFDQVLRRQANFNKLKPYVHQLEKALGHKCAAEAKKNVLKGRYQNAHTVLIDLPDYDKRSLAEMRNDLNAIQNWWENELSYNDEGYNQKPNLVIFIQKELFKGHFWFKKLDKIELKPFLSKELVQYYKKKFGSAAPFTDEALEYVAGLSRGIFRNFKRYIGTCTDELIMSEPKKETIAVDDVTAWISEGQLVEDMELELIDVFPNEKILRMKTVRLLHMLRKMGGSMMQTDVAKVLFDGQAKAASRFLDRLEGSGYIFRDSRAGKARGQRIVRLNNGGE